MSLNYYVYILASKKNGTIYIGMTNNLDRRISKHKSGIIKGFTSKWGISRLVYYETTNDVSAALQREKQLKKWKRVWKINLIETSNPQWLEIILR